MTAFRTHTNGSLIGAGTFRFTFDGKPVEALEGDTIASALLANDIAIVGRSFKYHRPRGIWGFGVEEPNGFVDISVPHRLVNGRISTELARAGMSVRSVNASPNAESDRMGFLDRFSRFLASGFYYKTFMWPDWHLFEPSIRRMAGLGVVEPTGDHPRHAEQVFEACDLLIVGGGPAGLFAASLASEAGLSVMLCDDGVAFGGSLLHRAAVIGGRPARDWVASTIDRLTTRGAKLLPWTTAFGLYDHGVVALNERQPDGRPDRLWMVRPKHILLTTGAIERPLPFANNDLPGILSAEAGLAYLRRYGIAVGRKVVIASNNSLTGEVGEALEVAGVSVTRLDYRKGQVIESASGSKRVERVTLTDGTVIAADAVLVSGGFTPTLHLYAHAKGKLRWDDKTLAFLPQDAREPVRVAGTAAGAFGLEVVFDSVARALDGIVPGDVSRPAVGSPSHPFEITAAWPRPKAKGRVWIDFQHDVTAKDVELAARENFVSVEHLKRYTTLGMATDQGKTSNLNGLALMAAITDREIPEVGTTTYRPPFTPVPFTSLASLRTGKLMNPVRHLPLEEDHLKDRGDAARIRRLAASGLVRR